MSEDMFYSYNVEKRDDRFIVSMYDNNKNERHEICSVENEKIANFIMESFDDLAIADERDMFDDPTPVPCYE